MPILERKKDEGDGSNQVNLWLKPDEKIAMVGMCKDYHTTPTSIMRFLFQYAMEHGLPEETE